MKQFDVDAGKGGRRSSRRALRGLSIAWFVVACSAAHGQGSVEKTNYADQLTEVVVTAERRSQNVQDVSASIQVLDEKTLEDSGVKDIRDVAVLSPGVQVLNSQPGLGIIVIRGVNPI